MFQTSSLESVSARYQHKAKSQKVVNQMHWRTFRQYSSMKTTTSSTLGQGVANSAAGEIEQILF
jgi:hypothetical protein